MFEPSFPGPPPTRAQTMALQGIVATLLVGLLLPTGLIAGLLALRESPARGAIEHGELFLTAANVTIAGLLLLVTSRTDRLLWTVIVTLIVLLGVVTPCYLLWAATTVQVQLEEHYSTDVAIVWGAIYALIAIVLAMAFAWVSYQPSAVAADNR